DKQESWENLLDPQDGGEIVLPDPSTSGSAYLFISTIMQIRREEARWDYLEQLDKNDGECVKSGNAHEQMVAQGEYTISITCDQAIYNRIDEGYPLEAVIPEEGVGYDLDVVWMFKNTEKRELVEEVIDYIGSEKGMEKSAEHRSMVTKPDVQGTGEEIEDHL